MDWDASESLARAATAFALAFSFAAAWGRRAGRWGFVDRPNARSLHTRPVARGGGAAILAAALLATLVWPPGETSAGPLLILAGTAALGLAGLWDDRFGLSRLARLALQFALAVTVVTACGGLDRLPLPGPLDLELGALGVPLACAWLVAVVNFYNFLDGVDGLATLQGAITGTAIALCGWHAWASAFAIALAAACAAFLRFNWSPARLFMGDAGSGSLGFAFAASPLLAPASERSDALLVVAVSLCLFLADAAWTLARRVARGERWYEAHRQHLYQRLALSGWTHARVAGVVCLLALPATLLALGYWRSRHAAVGWLALGVAVAAFGVELLLARRQSQSAV